jgi:hypothetical protein
MGFQFLSLLFFCIRPSQAYVIINTCFIFVFTKLGDFKITVWVLVPPMSERTSESFAVCVIRVGFMIFAVGFSTIWDSDAKPISKCLLRPFPVALLIYFHLDQMAPGSCDCMGVLLITLFISPSAQFKGQTSCNTFAIKINHSSPLLFGHHTFDICSVPHYTPKLLDLNTCFYKLHNKGRQDFCWSVFRSFGTCNQSKGSIWEDLVERQGDCKSPKAPDW